MSEKVTIKVERRELHLPTIALRGLVVFPNNLVHFEVGREKSIAAVEWAMANNSNVFLVAQKEMETNDPDLLRQKSDELSDLRFHQEELFAAWEAAMEEQEAYEQTQQPEE